MGENNMPNWGRMSMYPNGFNYGVSVRGVPILNTYGGMVYWVDSVAGSDGNKGTFDQPFASIDYAVGRCTANNGDIIIAKPGHIETVTAAGGLDLDVADITIIFQGQGTNQAYVTFTTDADADMDVDAANITLINPKFVAGIDSLTGPIDVNSTDFTIINGEWHDATDVETEDCIIATAGATRLCIDGWKFYHGTETDTQKDSHIQLNGCDDIVLRNIDIEGNFNVGNIENVTDEVLNARFENMTLKNFNTTPKPAIFLDAAATGICRNVKLHIYSGTTFCSSYGAMAWDDQCEGFSGASAPAGQQLGTSPAAGVEEVLSNIRSDLTIIDAALDSDMSVIRELLSDMRSVLVEGQSNIRSDLTVIDAALDSDMSVIRELLSDMRSVLVEGQSNIRSDLTVIDAALDSDMSVIRELLSDMRSVLVEAQSNIRSDLTVIDAALDSDMSVIRELLSDMRSVLVEDHSNIRSDLAVIDAALDSDISALREYLSNIRSDLTVAANYGERCVSNAVVFTSANQSDVFTVGGGPIMATCLQIVITTTCSSSACKIAWVADPTTGSDTDITLSGGASVSSGLDVNGLAAGTIIQADLDGTVAAAFASGTALPTNPGATMVIPVGGIDLDVANASLSSGAGVAYLRYKPLSKSSTVTGG